MFLFFAARRENETTKRGQKSLARHAKVGRRWPGEAAAEEPQTAVALGASDAKGVGASRKRVRTENAFACMLGARQALRLRRRRA